MAEDRDDDWSVLGLRPGASEAEVRDAYRALAKRYHPDRRPGDVSALQRFQRISEAYAALRRQRREGQPAPARPLTATARQASLRPVTELASGGGLWVSPDALMVAPDRSTELRRDARGTDYPTVSNTVRLEQRRDGLHAFIPPQPSVRWQLSPAAESLGLPLSTLWVGDRQQERGALAPRMPVRLLGGSVAEMAVGDLGWVADEAIAPDGEGRWWLQADQPLSPESHPATPVRVLRDESGWWAYSEQAAGTWAAVTPAMGAQLVALTGVVLAGWTWRAVTAPAG